MSQEKNEIEIISLGVVVWNLVLDDTLGAIIRNHIAELQTVTQTGIGLGIPVPGLTAALNYYDSTRAKRLPANLIRAERLLWCPYLRTSGQAQSIPHRVGKGIN